MKQDRGKTKEQLIKEVSELRRRVCELEKKQDEVAGADEEWRRLAGVQSMILNNSIMGIAVVRRRTFEKVNPRLAAILGLPLDKIQGASARLIYASDGDYESYGRQIYPTLRTGQWFERELDVKRPDGKSLSIRVIGKAFDPSSADEGSLWILEDVTERRRVEESLRESEEKYRTVVEKSTEGIVIAQGERLVYVNPKMADDILGIPAEKLIGQPFHGFIHPEDRDLVVSRYRRRLAGEEIPDSYEFRLVGINGKITWVYLSAKRIQWNGQSATLNLYTDITERKQTETALRESEAQYRLLVDNTYDLIWTLNVRGEFTYASPSWKRTVGREASFVVGKAFRSFVHPDDVDACTQTLLESIGMRKEMGGIVYRVKHADHTWRWHETSGTPVYGPDGSFLSFVGVSRDITDRKEAEEQLKKSQSTLSSIIEFLPDATVVRDLEGKVIAWNLAMEKMTGVSKQEAFERKNNNHTISFYGKHRKYLLDLIDSNDQDLESLYRYVKREGNALYAETFAPALYGGRGAHVFAAAAPLFDNRGNRFGLIELIRDVTDYRRAEEELREAHRRLDEIIEYLPDATFVINAEGKVIAWNKAMELMTGIDATEMLGKGNYEYSLPFYGERRPILIDLVLKPQKKFEAKYVHTERQGMVLDGEAYMFAHKGEEAYLSGRASALKDFHGNIVGAIESIRDITARRKAEEKYRGIFDNAVMGIFHTTPEGRIIHANPAFAGILGYESPEDVVATVNDIAGQMYVHPQERSKYLNLMNEQGGLRNHELQLVRKDGSTVLVSVSGRAVRNGTGKLLYYEGTIQDITEQRRLEHQLRQAQKMEAIGTLAGGIAHDFNNILASLIGFTEMAARESRQDVRRKYLDRVLQACGRAKNLINQILSFSRTQEQELKPFDVKLILKEALSLMRATLPSTIEIRHNITKEETKVLADPTQIHQIMINLCTNAAHAMREKGGILDIRLSCIEIFNPELAPHPDLPLGFYVVLSVSDTGHGIDHAIKDKIFDPFFTTKSSREGTGLGLSVVYGIVRQCGGAIDVQSTMGRGAVFTIYLPRISSEDSAGEPGQEETEPQGNERILFIDDEESLVTLARAFFESRGYHVTATVNSLDAFRLFQKNPDGFDLVITDMTMPEITGAELVRAFLKIRADIPIILCTGYSDSISVAEVRKLKIREFVLKPVALNDLGRLVRRVLDS